MTKPTKGQERACDLLAEALVTTAEAVRLDGRGAFGKADMHTLAATLARASSAFTPETVVSRALERRGRALNLRAGTAELLGLTGSAPHPLEMLLAGDDEFRALVEAADRELGEFA